LATTVTAEMTIMQIFRYIPRRLLSLHVI